MAGIADMLIGSALQSAQNAPDISGAMVKGAELGQHIQNMQLKRQELDNKKAEHNLQKYSKVTDLIKIAHESKDPAIANSLWKYGIPSAVQALGAGDVFTPEFLETAAKSPETREKTLGFQMEIQHRLANMQPGETPQGVVDEVKATISDPVVRATLDTDRLLKAQETAAAEKQMNLRNERTAQASLGKQIQGQTAAPFVKAKEEVAKEWAKYTAIGGKAALDKTEAALEEAIADLEKKRVSTGKGVQAIPVIGDANVVVKTTNKPLQALRNKVLSTQNIKALSGDPNPTAQQISDINARILDASAGNETNIDVLKSELQRVRTERAGKEASFKETGFLPRSSPSGEIKEWQGKKYKLIKDRWVEVK